MVVMYIITSKLNSTFRTIGKATGIKMTGKAVGKKKETFALAWRIIWTNCHGAKHVCKILNNFFFLLKQVSSLQLEWKFIVIELPCAFLSFGSLYLGILGFKNEQ